MEASEVLKQVAGEVVACKACPLYASARRAVPGEGQAATEIMLIGEAPGFYENEQGRPFVGASGKFLDELLHSAGVKREDVFITNVIKHRPPGNRDPEPGELAACRGFLERQIEAINPKVIVTLGRFSMGHFLTNARISAIHGSARWVNGRLIVPMFHPAAALHQPDLRDAIMADFARLPRFIEMATKARETGGQAAPAAQPPAVTGDQPIRAATEQPGLFGGSPSPGPDEDQDNHPPIQLSLF